jgi:hypothetical protein
MKYPIGIQDFRELREGGYVYVDKTEYLHRIIEGGKHFFLSRPRRFGKSLLLSTINELYKGSKELFQGLWIENHWDWEGEHRPVIWLKFSSQGIRTMGLEAGINAMLTSEADRLGIRLETTTFDLQFKELIQKVGKEKKVTLLIDEYDKPIIDHLDDPQVAEAHREILKSFYSILKDSDPYLELVFITGVSAFSKVSIFSDLNNLYNLSLVAPARTLLGITQEELEHYFAQPLKTVDKEEVRRWYNGYSWGGTERVYNPFSILSFFRGGGEYRNFWFETGTPTFLVKEMKKRSYFNLRDTLATQHDLNSFDLRNLQPIPILFQTGYLTIKHYEPADLVYTLDYPNQEVRHSLQEVLLKEYLDYPSENPVPKVLRLREAMRSGHLEEAFQIINSAFSEIPYDHWKGQTEHFYHAVVALIFSLLGTYIRSEVHSSRGRCDALVETADRIYALEFKLDKSAGEALQQIQDKGYLEPYADSLRQKIAVGINFSSTERRIVEWEAVELYF